MKTNKPNNKTHVMFSHQILFSTINTPQYSHAADDDMTVDKQQRYITKLTTDSPSNKFLKHKIY